MSNNLADMWSELKSWLTEWRDQYPCIPDEYNIAAVVLKKMKELEEEHG